MPITSAPFTLKDTSLTLKIGTDAAQEYRCQLSAVSLVPSTSTGGGNTLTTFCDDYSDAGSSATTWELNLSGWQSYADANDFSLWAFENDGAKADFVLIPGQNGGVISATNPGFSGVVTVRPTVIGGTAKTWAVFDVNLPCDSRPTLLTAPSVAAFSASAKA